MSKYTTGINCQICGKPTGRNINDHKILCFYCYRKLSDIKPDKDSKQYRQWVLQEFYARPLFYGDEPDWKMIEKLEPHFPEPKKIKPKKAPSKGKRPTIIETTTEFRKTTQLTKMVDKTYSTKRPVNIIDANVENEDGYPQSCFDGWD